MVSDTSACDRATARSGQVDRSGWGGRVLGSGHFAGPYDCDHATPLEKHPGLSGGLSSLITTPFAIVMGTASADPLMNRRCKEKAEGFAAVWEGWQHQRPRIFTDVQLTPQDEQRYSLLLVGGADANLVSRRMLARLPLRVEADGISIDGRKFAVTDAVVQMIYPSAAAQNRYVLVVASTSTAGMYFWNPGGLWNVPFGYPTFRMNWIIRDGRQVSLEPGLGSERKWVDYADGVLRFQRDSSGATTGATFSGDPGNLVLKKLPG